MQSSSTHRTPRVGVDPIRDPATALRVVRLAMHHPPVDQVVAVLLDHERRGGSIVVVTGTARPDDVLDVAERMTEAALGADHIDALVLASIRPGRGVDPYDGDRWLEMSELCELTGVELVEWFVVGVAVTCPRDLLGEAPRW